MEREHENMLMRYLDGGLDEADAQRLNELIKTNGEFQKEFLELTRQERVLRVLLEPGAGEALCRQVVNQLKAQKNGDEFVDRVQKEITGRNLKPTPSIRNRSASSSHSILAARSKRPLSVRSSRVSRIKRKPAAGRNAWAWPMGLAAIILIMCGLYFATEGMRSAPNILAAVELVSGNDVVAENSAGKHALHSGSALASGETLRTGAGAQVRFKYSDGTWIELGGSSALTLTQTSEKTGKQMRLSAGSFMADVTPQPEGTPFTVATPHGRATVRGTILAMSVSENDTRLEVRRGKVALERLADHAEVLVAEDHFAIAGREAGVALKSELIQSAAPAPAVAVRDGAVKDFLTRVYQPAAGAKLPYRLFVPLNYDKSQKYPLVLFLHGLYESGNDNTRPLNNDANGAMVFVKAKSQSKHPCFMLVPQAPKGWWPDAVPALVQLIAGLKKEYNLDADRLYVTGLSFGGSGTWDIVCREPNLFAAAVPIAGAGDPASARAIIALPIWNFHTADDTVMKVQGSRGMIDALRKAGGHPNYTEYSTGGHGSAWERAYKDDAMLEWLFAQARH